MSTGISPCRWISPHCCGFCVLPNFLHVQKWSSYIFRNHIGLFQFINRRFLEITGKDNLTVFSYSGRVKSPEWRWQLRRADLWQLLDPPPPTPLQIMLFFPTFFRRWGMLSAYSYWCGEVCSLLNFLMWNSAADEVIYVSLSCTLHVLWEKYVKLLMSLLLATLSQGVHCVSVLIMTGVDINTSVNLCGCYCVCVLGGGG